MSDIIKKHVIAILVDNEFGALARITELFSARGYNIESLTVAPVTQDKKLSRITVTTYGSAKTVTLICNLLKRLIPVHSAAELTKEEGYIERELALVQILGNEEKQDKVRNIIEKYKTNIIEITNESIVFEILGNSKTIDEVLEKLFEFGVDSISRTGIAAGFKGSKILGKL